MTLTQQLTNFISSASQSDEFQISKTELLNHFGGIAEFLHQKGWLIQVYQKRFLCPECGATHEVHFLRDRFFVGCDIDEDAEPLELSKNELIVYSFSFEQLAQWLNKQLKLTEEVTIVGDGVWYLGLLKIDGKNRRVYLTPARHLGSVPQSPYRVVLMIDNTEHQQFTEAINLLTLLSASENGFEFNVQQLINDLSQHITLDGEAVKISDNLLLNQEGERTKRKCWVRFEKQDGGKFFHLISIKPLMYNIVYYLDRIRKTPQSRKSSAEMATTGAGSRSKRSITNRIEELNKIFTDRNWPKIILRDNDNKYYINPDLYNK